MSRPRASLRHARRGMTLIELLLSVTIVAVLVAVAVPSMYEFIMRKKVEGAADELLVDLRYARSMLAKNNRVTIVKFGKSDTDTCYVMYHPLSQLECDCTASPVCSSVGASSAVELKTVRLPSSSRVTMTPAEGTSAKLQLEAPTGLPANGSAISITIKASSGGEVRLSTSQTGRPQLCSVSGHASAYPACATPSRSD